MAARNLLRKHALFSARHHCWNIAIPHLFSCTTMPNFDYSKIQRDMRQGNVIKFRTKDLYSNVPLETAAPIEKLYIDGEIDLKEFTMRLEAVRNGTRQ
jgi:hypothetical protein